MFLIVDNIRSVDVIDDVVVVEERKGQVDTVKLINNKGSAAKRDPRGSRDRGGSLLPFGARHHHRCSEWPETSPSIAIITKYAFPCRSSIYLFLFYSYDLSQVKTTKRNPFYQSLNYFSL